MGLVVVVIVLLKFVVPAFMFVNPFVGAWGNYFLDIVDGDILRALGMSEFGYQSIDKFADLVSYIFMFAVGIRWGIKRPIKYLFGYRMIGQIGFFITRSELWFVYFQNFLEPLVLVYTFLIFKKRSEKKAHQTYLRHRKKIWGGVIVYKLWNEWYLHYANIDLSTIFFGFSGGS